MQINRSSQNEVLLQFRDLYIEAPSGRGWHPIVKGISFVLRRGEVLGLIGESGAGKSTLGLAAMGYARGGCRISSGEILFRGHNILKFPKRTLRELRGGSIAYVAQSAASAFNPAHSIIDQYVEAVKLHRIRPKRQIRAEAVAMYRRLRLPDPHTIGDRYPHELSGGQLQRAMVAMAMACQPDVIVFDEPTTALDVTTQLEVLAAIKDLVSQSGVAALYISHDLAVVSQMADSIIVLRNGSVVEENTADQLISNPQEAYTKQLLEARPVHRRATETTQMIIEIADLNVGYSAAVPVLHGLNLSIAKGTTLGVVGESGSGKSTLGRVVSGLLAPRSGRLLFDGKPLPGLVSERSQDLLWKIQMIHQIPDAALNPSHRIRETIGRVSSLRHNIFGVELVRRTERLMTMCGLDTALIDRLPSELSGGQKQRVCIARAIAADPQLIICDEVTSALDPLVARGIIDLLGRLQRETGVCYLFITHDLVTMSQISDRVMVLQNGRVVESGNTTALLADPKEAYTRSLLAAVPSYSPGWLASSLQAAAL